MQISHGVQLVFICTFMHLADDLSKVIYTNGEKKAKFKRPNRVVIYKAKFTRKLD